MPKELGLPRALSISSVCDIIHKVILEYKKNKWHIVFLFYISCKKRVSESVSGKTACHLKHTLPEKNGEAFFACGFERKLKE
ncbi:hypothetical protein A3849_24645 [Paenibacillus sp. P46E]|nr:hypothetical protein A3849_24645 [Paenibacillus sp. P46E]